jgi:hypothetical protein
LIASGDGDTIQANDVTVQMWDWKSGAPPAKLNQGRSSNWPSNRAVFSPNGRTVVAEVSGHEEQLSVWDTASRKLMRVISGAGFPVAGITFSPDGSRFATLGTEGSIRVWDALTYEPLLDSNASASFVGFGGPDASLLLFASGNWVRIWDTRSSYYPGAAELVANLRGQTTFASEIMDQLRTDSKLDPELRKAAIELVRMRGENVAELNERAWQVVRAPGGKAGDYREALRQIEAAVKADPLSPGAFHTLGVAQYRSGLFREALESLRRSEELRDDPGNLVFAAMAHFKSGEVDQAHSELRKVRDEEKSAGAEMQAFLREAGALIEGAGKK